MNKTEYDYLKLKYDQNCKKLLKNKAILANIMKYLIKDYKDMDIQTIMNYIEDGEQTPLIKGQNNEDYSPDGSEIEYDVLYTAKKPGDNSTIKIIINIEVQNNIYLKYPIIKRALYYASRLLSKQKGEYFSNSNYQDLCEVYTIWILISPNKDRSGTINHYTIKENNIIGDYKENINNYNLLNIIMVGINDNNTNSEIINMLNKLFLTTKDTAKSNANILKTRYNINIEKKESENMITFGEGLFNYGMIQGTEEGYKKGFNKGIKDGNKKGRELGIKEGKELGIKEGKELGIKKGKELGIKEGIKTGQIETLAKNVINLSKSLNISNKEAMKLLKISKNNQNEVIKKIKHLSK